MLSLYGIGPLARVREMAFGSGALCVAMIAAFLAQAARPPQSKSLGSMKVEQDAVVVNGTRLGTANGEVSLQYQLVESPALGMNLAVPLAFVGAKDSVPIAPDGFEGWMLEATWKRAEALNARGISVRRKTEAFRISPGESYEVLLGEREPSLKKRASP